MASGYSIEELCEQRIVDATREAKAEVELYKARWLGCVEPLDKAWEQINALGGIPSTDHDKGYVKAIFDALAILEDLGAQDPLARNRDNGQFGVGA